MGEATIDFQALRDAPPVGRFSYLDYNIDYVAPRALERALRLIYETRVYEVDIPYAKLIIDAGAWIGASILYFRRRFPQAKILGFEPDPILFPVLRANVDRNAAGVELHNVALGAHDGAVEFRSTGSDSGSMRARNGGREVTVTCAPLSQFIEEPVSLLKLNVEGAEWEVIEELGDKLRLVEHVLIEYHGFSELPQTLHCILQRLDEAGMTYLVSHFGDANAVCVPPLRIKEDYRYFLLIYARRLREHHRGR